FIFAQEYQVPNTPDGRFVGIDGPGMGDPDGIFAPFAPADAIGNNNSGLTGTGFYTQNTTTQVAFGNTVVLAYFDSGSDAGYVNRYTGFSRSTDGGATFTDRGALLTSIYGDTGDPVMARNATTGRIFLATTYFAGSESPF